MIGGLASYYWPADNGGGHFRTVSAATAHQQRNAHPRNMPRTAHYSLDRVVGGGKGSVKGWRHPSQFEKSG
jgi:hypothetical protein